MVTPSRAPTAWIHGSTDGDGAEEQLATAATATGISKARRTDIGSEGLTGLR